VTGAAGSPLGVLLWVDEEYHADVSLAECFGDSYLVALNPVAAGVRRSALELGARFVDEPGELAATYRVAPLTALDEILTTGVVPYQGDVEVLRRLAADDTTSGHDAAALRGFFRGHLVMHESAHLIADRTLGPPRPDRRSAGDHSPAVAGLLAESLANAVETLGIVHVDHDTHEVFYDWNAQIRVPEPRRSVLRALARRYGMARLVEMSLWVFFHLHMRADTDACSPAYRRACADAVLAGKGMDEAEQDLAVAAVAATVTLNPKARAATTPAYCRLYGTADDLDRLTALDIDDPDVVAELGLAEAVKRLAAVTDTWFPPESAGP
jgi:hypothetical protein